MKKIISQLLPCTQHSWRIGKGDNGGYKATCQRCGTTREVTRYTDETTQTATFTILKEGEKA